MDVTGVVLALINLVQVVALGYLAYRQSTCEKAATEKHESLLRTLGVTGVVLPPRRPPDD